MGLPTKLREYQAPTIGSIFGLVATVPMGNPARVFFHWLRRLTPFSLAIPVWVTTRQMTKQGEVNTGILHSSYKMMGSNMRFRSLLQQATWFGHYLKRLATCFVTQLATMARHPASSTNQALRSKLGVFATS